MNMTEDSPFPQKAQPPPMMSPPVPGRSDQLTLRGALERLQNEVAEVQLAADGLCSLVGFDVGSSPPTPQPEVQNKPPTVQRRILDVMLLADILAAQTKRLRVVHEQLEQI